jgi:hypothetical protein
MLGQRSQKLKDIFRDDSGWPLLGLADFYFFDDVLSMFWIFIKPTIKCPSLEAVV